MKKVTNSIFTFCFVLFCNNALYSEKIYSYLDLNSFGQEQYQDIIINGKVVSSGVRYCQERYDAIRPILDRYKRPITVLDLGASQGYFSLSIARDYDATCVMIEGNYNKHHGNIADQLEQLCHLNSDLENIVFLKKHISPSELKKLAECEHFDVVLAFNVIHHFGNDWQDVAKTILSLGDNIIIETPPSDDIMPQAKIIKLFLENQGGKLIAEVPRHTSKTLGKMYWFEKNKIGIERTYWINEAKILYPIISDYMQKKLYNPRKKTYSEWHQGINLTTFYALNGIYPTRKLLRKQIVNISKTIMHPDFTIWNLIIQGNTIIPIDTDDFLWNLDQKKCLDALLELFNLEENYNPEETLRKYFEHVKNNILLNH